MRLKSYFVHTMEEALQTAKSELGEEAMLVDSKRLESPPGGRPRLEVIFAAPAPLPPPVLATPAAARPAADLRRFRGELTSILDALSRQPGAARLEPFSPAAPQLETLRSRLRLSEVPVAFLDGILQLCRPAVEGMVLRGVDEFAGVERALLPLLAAEWPPLPAHGGDASRTLAFVGPAGAGKTLAIAKLAFHFGVQHGISLRVVSIDSLRVGASDHLAHICSLLGVPFQSLDFSGGLGAALGDRSRPGLVLIDTPGFGPGDDALLAETASDLSRIANIESHLVLPASMRFVELQSRHRQFSAFRLSRLFFTRLDETEFCGPAWAFARHCQLPVEWGSTGPGITDGLTRPDATQLLAAVIGNRSYLEAGLAVYSNSPRATSAAAGAART